MIPTPDSDSGTEGLPERAFRLPVTSDPLTLGAQRLLSYAVRRPTSFEPAVVRAYERLVVAREGIREFRVDLEREGGAPPEWTAAAALAESFIAQAQRLLEELR